MPLPQLKQHSLHKVRRSCRSYKSCCLPNRRAARRLQNRRPRLCQSKSRHGTSWRPQCLQHWLLQRLFRRRRQSLDRLSRPFLASSKALQMLSANRMLVPSDSCLHRITTTPRHRMCHSTTTRVSLACTSLAEGGGIRRLAAALLGAAVAAEGGKRPLLTQHKELASYISCHGTPAGLWIPCWTLFACSRSTTSLWLYSWKQGSTSRTRAVVLQRRFCHIAIGYLGLSYFRVLEMLTPPGTQGQGVVWACWWIAGSCLVAQRWWNSRASTRFGLCFPPSTLVKRGSTWVQRMSTFGALL